jgi:type I restriction enzyme M protein
MQKFTDAEQAGFDRKKKTAKEETQDKYQSQLDELQAVIDQPNYPPSHFLAGKAQPTPEEKRAANEQASAANEELRQRRAEAKRAKRELEERIRREARALLKERFPYAIFLYDAEKVGITATGEQDQNELYPNDNQPPGLAKTCLELFQEFKQDTQPFFVTGFRD